MAVFPEFCLIFLFLPLSKQDDTHDVIAAVLHSVEDLIKFYNDDYMNLNVDGYYGLRVLEGHTEAILQKYSRGQLGHLSLDVISQLKVLKLTATTICNNAWEHVKRDNVNYFNTMSFVVGSPWDIFDNTRRTVDPSKAWPQDVYSEAKKTVNLDEKQSDLCMSELMGSHREGGARCDISEECVRVMTTPGLLAYGITHQLLWTMLAEKAGCEQQLQEKLLTTKLGSLTAIRHDLCSNNYLQLHKMLGESGLVNMDFQDLFLEQLFVCPSLGYHEFLRVDFLPQILAWQFPSGCFGEPDDDDPGGPDTNSTGGAGGAADAGFNLGSFIREVKIGDDTNETSQSAQQTDGRHHKLQQPGAANRQSPQLGQGHNSNGRNSQNLAADGVKVDPIVNGDQGVFNAQPNKGRKLLVEKKMAGGCLSHKTAVATGALIMYLRYLCEPDADTLFTHTRQTRSIGSDLVLNATGTDHRLQPGKEKDGILGHKFVYDVGEKDIKSGFNNSMSLGEISNRLDEQNKLLDNTKSELKKKVNSLNQNIDERLQNEQNKKLINSADTSKQLLPENPAHIAHGQRFIQPPLDVDKLGVIKPRRNPYQSPLNWQLGQQPENAALTQHNPAVLTDYNQVPAAPDTRTRNRQHRNVVSEIESHQGEPQGNPNVNIDNDSHRVAVPGLPGNKAKGTDKDTEMYEYKYDNNDDDGDYDDDDDDDDEENEDEYYVDGHGNAKKQPAHHQLQLPPNGANYNDNDVNKFNEDDNYDDDDDDDDGYGNEDYDKTGDNVDNDTPIHDKVNVGNPHGHINARNLVHAANKERNKMHDIGDQNYKYDDSKADTDDDDDEYTYDDTDQEQADTDSVKVTAPASELSRHPKQSHSGALKSSMSMSHIWSQSMFYMFVMVVIVVILLVYRFLKKRKIRLRFHPSMLYKV